MSRLLSSTRQGYHQQRGHGPGSTVSRDTATRSELLAHHYTEAGLHGQASHTGTRRDNKRPNAPHIGSRQPPHQGPRSAQETTGQPRAPPARAGRADHPWSSVDGDQGVCGSRSGTHLRPSARAVPAGGGDTQLFPVLRGLWNFYLIRRELRTARELAEQLLGLAQRAQDPVLLQQAHSALAGALVHLGEFAATQAHLQQGLALYDPLQRRARALPLELTLACFSSPI